MICMNYTGEVPERSKGADCKSAGEAFGGSNPPPSTIYFVKAPAALGGAGSPVGTAPGAETAALSLGRGTHGIGVSSVGGVETAWGDEGNGAGIAQLARASAFQAEGCGFESRFPLQGPRSSVGRALPW